MKTTVTTPRTASVVAAAPRGSLVRTISHDTLVRFTLASDRTTHLQLPFIEFPSGRIALHLPRGTFEPYAIALLFQVESTFDTTVYDVVADVSPLLVVFVATMPAFADVRPSPLIPQPRADDQRTEKAVYYPLFHWFTSVCAFYATTLRRSDDEVRCGRKARLRGGARSVSTDSQGVERM